MRGSEDSLSVLEDRVRELVSVVKDLRRKLRKSRSRERRASTEARRLLSGIDSARRE